MKYFFVCCFLVIMSSCSNSKKEKKSEYEIKSEKREKLKSLNEERSLEFTEKYGAINDWETDTLFTYKLQERLEDTIISFIGSISDITLNRNDPFKKYGGHQINDGGLPIFNTYTLKLTSIQSEFIAEISINELQLKELMNKFSKGDDRTGCFILRVNKIQSMFPVLKSEGDVDIHGGNDEDGYDYDVDTYLTYEYDNMIIKFTASLIDHYAYQQ